MAELVTDFIYRGTSTSQGPKSESDRGLSDNQILGNRPNCDPMTYRSSLDKKYIVVVNYCVRSITNILKSQQ